MSMRATAKKKRVWEVNAKLLELLEPHREAVRAAVRKPVVRWKEAETMPDRWGFYASDAVVFCRNCGLVLPFAWKAVRYPCFCGRPEPVILLPFSVLPQNVRDELIEAVAEDGTEDGKGEKSRPYDSRQETYCPATPL
ncbi:MAG: hypothetical protein IMW94_04375 [Thermoanaerobacter sp.]|nr:hypothetical protein [Thermoanaerobacter sp.]